MIWGFESLLWCVHPCSSLDRAPGSEPGGSRFESCQGYMSRSREFSTRRQGTNPNADRELRKMQRQERARQRQAARVQRAHLKRMKRTRAA